MSAINKIAKEWAGELRDGIAWLIVWKTGRSWNAQAVWLNPDTDTFEPDDLELAKKILKKDPNAVMVNGYYCGHFGEAMTVSELAAGIRWHYENGCNILDGSTAFPPESIECPADVPAALPCYDKDTSAEPNPCVYESYINPEDCKLMHKNMKSDRQQENHTSAAPGPLSIDERHTAKPIRELQLLDFPLSEPKLPELRSPPVMAPALSLSPDMAAAIVNLIFPVLSRFFENIVKNAMDTWAVLKKAAKPVFRCMARITGRYMDAMLKNANDHPKWWHYYKHAKKWRVRKKYRRRLIRQLHNKLLAAAGSEVST